MYHVLSVDGENSFHRTVLLAEFGEVLSVRGILPWFTVHISSPNTEHTYTYNRFGGRELGGQLVFVGTAVIRRT